VDPSVPSIQVCRLPGDPYVPTVEGVADQRVSVSTPLDISVTPASLIAD
jgi:hypothetical protein